MNTRFGAVLALAFLATSAIAQSFHTSEFPPAFSPVIDYSHHGKVLAPSSPSEEAKPQPVQTPQTVQAAWKFAARQAAVLSPQVHGPLVNVSSADKNDCDVMDIVCNWCLILFGSPC